MKGQDRTGRQVGGRAPRTLEATGSAEAEIDQEPMDIFSLLFVFSPAASASERNFATRGQSCTCDPVTMAGHYYSLLLDTG